MSNKNMKSTGSKASRSNPIEVTSEKYVYLNPATPDSESPFIEKKHPFSGENKQSFPDRDSNSRG